MEEQEKSVILFIPFQKTKIVIDNADEEVGRKSQKDLIDQGVLTWLIYIGG